MGYSYKVERLLLAPPRESTADPRMSWTLADMKVFSPEWTGSEETGGEKRMLPLKWSKA